jgi:ABC-type Fe3+ transport system permease subunit
MNQRTVSERADFLSRRRARVLPVLAIIYLTQQASYISMRSGPADRPVDAVKISAWLVLSAVLLAALATKGFWLQPREVRAMIDDEVTRANRTDAMRFGFIFAILTCIVVYFITMFEPVNGRDAVHIVMSDGLGAALIRWGWLERRAHRDA